MTTGKRRPTAPRRTRVKTRTASRRQAPSHEQSVSQDTTKRSVSYGKRRTLSNNTKRKPGRERNTLTIPSPAGVPSEAPDDINFLAATTTVPLATPFKPAVKLLARKPAPRLVARRDPMTGLEKLTVQDDGEDEDGDAARNQPTPEEIRARQQRELDEKQRQYDEARAKIFGESRPSSGSSTPGTKTPPRGSGGEGGGTGRGQGQKGRGRGRGRNEMRGHNRLETSERRQADGNQTAGARELYDPNYSPKPGVSLQKRRDYASGSSSPATREMEAIIRKPRGPDGSGPGGFGFAPRGTRKG